MSSSADNGKSPQAVAHAGGRCLARRKRLRDKWSEYAYARGSRRLEFDHRHPNLQWLPNVIAILFLGVTGTALAMNFVSPKTGLSGYLLGLVTVDLGMAAVAVLAWIIGRKLWREDHDPRYLAAAIGFAGLPVWGVFETLCVSYLIPALSFSVACTFSTDYAYAAVAWLVLVPVGSILWDFRVYLATGELAPPAATSADSR